MISNAVCPPLSLLRPPAHRAGWEGVHGPERRPVLLSRCGERQQEGLLLLRRLPKNSDHRSEDRHVRHCPDKYVSLRFRWFQWLFLPNRRRVKFDLSSSRWSFPDMALHFKSHPVVAASHLCFLTFVLSCLILLMFFTRLSVHLMLSFFFFPVSSTSISEKSDMNPQTGECWESEAPSSQTSTRVCVHMACVCV